MPYHAIYPNLDSEDERCECMWCRSRQLDNLYDFQSLSKPQTVTLLQTLPGRTPFCSSHRLHGKPQPRTCNRVLQTRFRNPDLSRCLPSILTSYPRRPEGDFTAFYHLLSPRRAFCREQEELLPYLAIQSVLFVSFEIQVHTLMVI
jgi:hypothetical protein